MKSQEFYSDLLNQLFSFFVHLVINRNTYYDFIESFMKQITQEKYFTYIKEIS